MHNYTEDEKQALLRGGLSIHIRPVATPDAPQIHKIIQESIEKPSSTASLDSVPPLAKIQRTIQTSHEAPNVVYAVAVDVTSGNILGLLILGPFTGKPNGPRACFDRAASINVLTTEERGAVGPELERHIKSALIDHAVSSCSSTIKGVRTLVADMLVRKDDSSSQGEPEQKVFLDNGFKLAGTLEAMADKDGVLFNQIFLQRHV